MLYTIWHIGMTYWESAQPKFRKSQHRGMAFRGSVAKNVQYMYISGHRNTQNILT